jgi:hypothetical protein
VRLTTKSRRTTPTGNGQRATGKDARNTMAVVGSFWRCPIDPPILQIVFAHSFGDGRSTMPNRARALERLLSFHSFESSWTNCSALPRLASSMTMSLSLSWALVPHPSGSTNSFLESQSRRWQAGRGWHAALAETYEVDLCSWNTSMAGTLQWLQWLQWAVRAH